MFCFKIFHFANLSISIEIDKEIVLDADNETYNLKFKVKAQFPGIYYGV